MGESWAGRACWRETLNRREAHIPMLQTERGERCEVPSEKQERIFSFSLRSSCPEDLARWRLRISSPNRKVQRGDAFDGLRRSP